MSSSPPSVGQDTTPASGYTFGPFDPLTFDLNTVPKKFIKGWSQDPDIIPYGRPKPNPYTATSAREFYRRHRVIQVSPSVFKLGKDPYPGLRSKRWVDELKRSTPEYDYTKPWMGDMSSTLRRITPKKLLELGCINIDTGDTSPISPQFRVDLAAAAKASKDRSVCISSGNEKNIHPLFRRRQFRNTSDWEFEHLKPTLRIASLMLETSSVLDMLHALGSPLHKKPGTQMFPHDVWVYYTGRSTHMDRAETALELIKMTDFVSFTWMDGRGPRPSAMTRMLNKPGLRQNGISRACEVRLDDEWRYNVTGGTAMLASIYNPEAEDESSHLREQLYLANTIIHELAHAFYYNTASISTEIDAFCNDQRLAEEGHVIESMINANVTLRFNMANPYLFSLPFGVAAGRWPGAYRDNSLYKHLIKKSPAKDGVQYETEYIISMEYVRQFFCDDFWEGREMRYETTPLSEFAVVGVRMLFDESPEAFDASESPTVDEKHDNHRAGEYLPDLLVSGIIYKHEAFTFAEDKIEDGGDSNNMAKTVFCLPKRGPEDEPKYTADGESD